MTRVELLIVGGRAMTLLAPQITTRAISTITREVLKQENISRQ